jgi:hypothetical protein
MPSGGGDQAVEQAGVHNLIASAERFDDALGMAPAPSRTLSTGVEVPLAADLLNIMEQPPRERAFFPRYQCVILSRHRT